MGVWCEVTFDPNGGTLNSPQVLYYNRNSNHWYTAKTAPLNNYLITEITPPTRQGYIFNQFQFYDGIHSAPWYVGGNPRLAPLPSTSDFNQDTLTVSAWWRQYITITLYKGELGHGGTDVFYSRYPTGGYYSDRELTVPITSITIPIGEGTFAGYYRGGVQLIDGNGQFSEQLLATTYASDKVFTAEWIGGGGIDYFGLESPTLVAMESDDGANRPRVVTRHYGKAAGASQSGPVWLNPTVKYMVVGDMTLQVTLGKAFPKETGTINGPYKNRSGEWVFGDHSGMTKTGYMITEVTVDTRLGQFPIVTVRAVANEGADAINTFGVSIPVVARARPQNLMTGRGGGGSLQSVTCRAVCDPVVLSEGLEPCASDVVNGRYELRIETRADDGVNAPYVRNAFEELAIGERRTPRAWRNYGFEAVREVTT